MLDMNASRYWSARKLTSDHSSVNIRFWNRPTQISNLCMCRHIPFSNKSYSTYLLSAFVRAIIYNSYLQGFCGMYILNLEQPLNETYLGYTLTRTYCINDLGAGIPWFLRSSLVLGSSNCEAARVTTNRLTFVTRLNMSWPDPSVANKDVVSSLDLKVACHSSKLTVDLFYFYTLILI